jgi:phosphoribosylaminoimidazolecarboxamide formyltransferase/IMP cyclohydrolase
MNSRTALLSVYNKTGIVEFAQGLLAQKNASWEILASGGTAKILTENNIPVTDVGSIVGEPILGHRVVTLSREIHAGILAKDTPEDRAELEKRSIRFIDLVCCDMYPLAAEIAKPESTKESVIEQTDIGGPTMIRGAAKAGRIVICDPTDRSKVIEWLSLGEPDKEIFLGALAAKAEYIVASYVFTSARYHGKNKYEGFLGEQIAECKYGENGYQKPAFLYKKNTTDPLALEHFQLIEGTPPSFNNYADIDRLLITITHIAAGFDINYGAVPFIAIAVKHGNACGAAYGDSKEEVLKKMVDGDKRAIFGGLVMTNFEIDETLAEILLSYGMESGRRILDGIIAPSFSDEAIATLRRKGDKCRFLANGALSTLSKNSLDTEHRFRYVRGGFLVQPNYTFVLDFKQTELEKHGNATTEQEKDMLMAWAIGCTSNSNTISLVKDGMLIANGVGQQDRVGAAKLALSRATDAGHDIEGAVAYSDSFFPFPDAPETLINAGVKAIFSESGSVNDGKSIEICEKNNVPLYLIPDPLARGFFGH